MRKNIKAYQFIHSNLTASALPKESDFIAMKEEGYEVVISLCQPVDAVTLENEDTLVVNAGMKYLHFPVDFHAPQLEDYELLRDILSLLATKKVWLHCAKNYRASAFVCLYTTLEMGRSIEQAELEMERIWQPTEVWRIMMDEVLEKYAYQYL